LTKILGKCEEYFTPLPDKEMEMLHRLQGKKVTNVEIIEESLRKRLR